MVPEIGQFSLVLALVLASIQAVFPILGAARGNQTWMMMARPAAYGQFLFLMFSFLCLIYCFVVNDFTVRYVVTNSNSMLPVWYKVSAVWGGHEGSLLLWVVILSVWTAAVATFSRSLPLETVSRVLGVMGLISIGFMLFTLLTSNPFSRMLPDFPLDGNDLNPLLQDIGLILHPPMLYMGYVGFSVAFAFAIAGLLSGRLDSAWARWSRPWTTVAWCFLTVGIALGSWWAYYELGWGGWWFWDPVENASFMPWLAGTALVHSLAVTEKRGVFKAWTVLLAILSFSLSLLGTFLVRSGVLTSVHAFASDPERGMFILMFLLVVIGGSLLLFAIRAGALKGESRYQLFSREVMLMANNLLLVIAMTVVLLGTLYPLIADVLNLGKISVGPPYFDTLFVPLFIVLLMCMGVGQVIHWKSQALSKLKSTMVKLFITAVILGVLVPLYFSGDFYVSMWITMAAVFWVLLFLLLDLTKKVNYARYGWLKGIVKLPRSYKGMWLAHLGIIVTVTGIGMTSLYSVEKDVRLANGDRVDIGPYEFEFLGVKKKMGPNYEAQQGQIQVYRNGKEVALLTPEKRNYFVQRNMMTEASIDPGFTRDLYVALGEPLENGAWAVRVYFKPFIRWIWGGGLIMAMGGIFAISDRRYRLAREKQTEEISQGVSVS